MRQIAASEAKTHLPQLLTDVERGETVVITRHGRAIARLVPETDGRKTEMERLVEDIRAFGKRNGKITVEELISSKHEGHRY